MAYGGTDESREALVGTEGMSSDPGAKMVQIGIRTPPVFGRGGGDWMLTGGCWIQPCCGEASIC